jgi:hypothetical protein
MFHSLKQSKPNRAVETKTAYALARSSGCKQYPDQHERCDYGLMKFSVGRLRISASLLAKPKGIMTLKECSDVAEVSCVGWHKKERREFK